jgi:hypothetical protein
MIGSIFNPLDSGGFQRLVRIGQFFHALINGIFGAGEALRISGLACAARADLAGVIAEFVGCGLIVAFAFVGSFILCARGHVCSWS